MVRKSCSAAVVLLLLALCAVAVFSQQTDPATRMQWFGNHQQMLENSRFNTLGWQHIGPTNVSGRCTDVAVVTPRGEHYTMYVAAASGGVWKTVNDGVTWTPVFDKEASTSIGDVAVAPSNSDIVWAGTGEANIFRSSHAGAGIYKSTDAGGTWRHMGLAGTLTIARIIVHPTNPDIVYVAATGHEWTDNEERGVFKTTNGGRTWEKVLFISARTGANDLIMDPRNPDVLYASAWQRIRQKWNDPRVEPGYNEGGVYKTTNGGRNWTKVDNGLPAPEYRGRIGIDLCLTKPDVIYAFVDNYEMIPGSGGGTDSYGRVVEGRIKGSEIYRSDNGGQSWRIASSYETSGRFGATYGWVFAQIRVDPTDENTIYVMGLSLNVSYDGGKTFSTLRGMHSDHHGLWIDPDNSDFLVNTNDGGIVASYDGGANWRSFVQELPLTQFFNLSYDMDTPFHVFGSVQDHGSYRGEVREIAARGRYRGGPQQADTGLEFGRRFATVEFDGAPGGEGSSHAIDPTDPAVVYSAGFYGSLSRSNIETGERKSIQPVMFDNEPALRGQWVAPFIISPHNNEIIYHGLQYVFRSLNRGDTWERISPDLTYNDPAKMGDIPYQTLFSLSESPIKYGVLYAGTDDGRIHVTKDGGKTWTEINKGIPQGKWISRIEASRFDLGTVYMTQNGKREDDFTPYVWKSTDFGANWTSIAGNIPIGTVNVIREDPQNRNVLYVGTDVGVYVTVDGGMTWEVLGGNLPSTFVHDLRIHPRDDVIVIGTHGRGVWALDARPFRALVPRTGRR